MVGNMIRDRTEGVARDFRFVQHVPHGLLESPGKFADALVRARNLRW